MLAAIKVLIMTFVHAIIYFNKVLCKAGKSYRKLKEQLHRFYMRYRVRSETTCRIFYSDV